MSPLSGFERMPPPGTMLVNVALEDVSSPNTYRVTPPFPATFHGKVSVPEQLVAAQSGRSRSR